MSEFPIEIDIFIASLKQGYNQSFFYSPTTVDTAGADTMEFEEEYRRRMACTDCTDCTDLVVQVADDTLLITMGAFKP